ncbi:MAG: amidophosphoribosyltransferase [Elusimicrobia bacterium]|nr:amidophosphoribosyltransferase [Elusimicrobiota bacterium]
MNNHYPKEACGIFGIFGHKNAYELTYLGLYSLQHRGQESAGIAVLNEGKITCQKGMGLVNEVFSPGKLNFLPGSVSIGHVRYSTTGSSMIKNAQPFIVNYQQGSIAIAHNGNLVNTSKLQNKLVADGAIFQTTMDSELIVHLIARSRKNKVEDRVIDALGRIKGSYSLLFLTSENKLIAARDPHGFKPLCLGKINDSYVVASETCAFDITNAKYIRDIEPGEIVVIGKDGVKSIKPFPKASHSFCIFEYIYFARPDSNIFGGNVYLARKNLGRQLAKEWPVEADMVLSIPDSGNYAALGYSEESKIPFEMGIIRNHYVGRTFIQPFQRSRDLGVKLKLNPINEVIKGKRIIVVEDSIVRGTTSRIRMKTLREAGVKEIHMRISCPPLRYPCFYGIDFHTKEELIASSNSVNKIAKIIGVDSLCYLSLEGMLKSMPVEGTNFCAACFTGEYPVPTKEKISKYDLEK